MSHRTDDEKRKCPFDATHVLIDMDNTTFFTDHCMRKLNQTQIHNADLIVARTDRQDAQQLESMIMQFFHRIRQWPYRARKSMVTNAGQKWMTQVIHKYQPRLGRLLRDQIEKDRQERPSQIPTVRLISARARYERRYPDDYVAWKYFAFLDELYPLYLTPANRDQQPKRVQVVLLADGPVDQMAFQRVMQVLGKNRPETRSWVYKLISFADSPSLRQLRMQWNYVLTHMDRWLCTDHHLYVQVSFRADRFRRSRRSWLRSRRKSSVETHDFFGQQQTYRKNTE